MRRSDARGFSVVESLLGLALGTLVLGLVVGLAWWAAATFRRSEERLDPRERALTALAAVRAVLADAWACRLGGGGAQLQFTSPRGDAEIRFTAATHMLSIQRADDRNPSTLLDGVESFRARALRPGLIELRLQLARPAGAGAMAALGSLVVIDEVRSDAIWQRADSDWNPIFESPKLRLFDQ